MPLPQTLTSTLYPFDKAALYNCAYNTEPYKFSITMDAAALEVLFFLAKTTEEDVKETVDRF